MGKDAETMGYEEPEFCGVGNRWGKTISPRRSDRSQFQSNNTKTVEAVRRLHYNWR